jgi:hypothetical protein
MEEKKKSELKNALWYKQLNHPFIHPSIAKLNAKGAQNKIKTTQKMRGLDTDGKEYERGR